MNGQISSGTYTIVNPKTGGYRTLRLTDDTSWMSNPPRPGTRIVQFLNGPDNSRSFKSFGFVSPEGHVSVWSAYRARTDIVAAANWLTKHGAGREGSLGKAYAVRSGLCCFCNRKLTTPGSTHYGYGPDCAEKNGMPWTPNPSGCAADSARIGWQEVKVNPAEIATADGGTTTTAVKPRRTYEELFGEDN